MIGQYSCSAASRAAASNGGYNNYGYLATEPRMRPVIYPPEPETSSIVEGGNTALRPVIYPRQSKLSYSPSMRELTTGSYYGNNSRDSDFHGNHPQPLNAANLSNFLENRNQFHGNKRIKFPTLPPKFVNDRPWSDAGSDFVTSSLPRRQTRALPERHLTRHSSLNLQNRPQNIAVVEPSRNFYQGGLRRTQSRSQSSPWQPQEIRSQIARQPPPPSPPEGGATMQSANNNNKSLPWEPNQQPLPPKQQHQQQFSNVLPKQQQQQQEDQLQIEEEDVAYMGLQDHYDWIKQQRMLLLQQQEVSRQQQLRLQNYVHLPEQSGFHGNGAGNGHNTVTNGNYVSQRQIETSFTNQPNYCGNSNEIYGSHGNNRHSNPPPVPKKTFKSHGVLVLPELLPGQHGKLNHVARESSTDDSIDDNHGNNNNTNSGNHGDALSRNIHHERFRSISPIVEYLNDADDEDDDDDAEMKKNITNTMDTQNNRHWCKVPVTLIL